MNRVAGRFFAGCRIPRQGHDPYGNQPPYTIEFEQFMNNIEKSVSANESNISRIAYKLWESAGRPAGRDLEFWLAAETQVRAGGSKLTSTISKNESFQKSTRAARGGVKKSWPKPYPSLPKF